MLEKLLSEIQSGATIRPAILAKRLGTSVAMVEAMLDDLKRRGLVREVNLTCHETCRGCAFNDSCSSHPEQGRLWQITGKSQ